MECWRVEPDDRPKFSDINSRLRHVSSNITNISLYLYKFEIEPWIFRAVPSINESLL